MTYEVHTADCLQHMRTMPDNAVDAVVTDPPYGLTSGPNAKVGFMGKEWDKGVPGEVFWREALRVSKPGAHLLAFGGTRTFHRLTCAIEDAGWEIRDCIMWVHGCLSEDSEVLTREGWVHLHIPTDCGIIMDKEILVYDVQEDLYKWEKPSRWFAYRVHEDTGFRIQSDNTDQLVSRGHRCLVDRGGELAFVTAGELSGVEGVPVLREDVSGVCEGCGRLLQSGVQWCDTRERTFQTRAQGEGGMDGEIREVLPVKNERGEQSCMARRCDIHQEARELPDNQVCEVPGAVSAYGAERRVHHGASAYCGACNGAAVNANRGCASCEPQPSRQQDREPCCVCEQPGPQVARTRASYTTDMAVVTEVVYSGAFFCPTVSTGAFVARRNGKVFLTGNSGFPKSLDVSKAIDKAAGAEREVVGSATVSDKRGGNYHGASEQRPAIQVAITAPATDLARQWQGWGTALKPAFEPVIVARKPLDGTVAGNVAKWGTGGLNVDGCRVGTSDCLIGASGGSQNAVGSWGFKKGYVAPQPSGRFPANLVHDGSEEVLAGFPVTGAAKATPRHNNQSKTSGAANGASCYGAFNDHVTHGYDDLGGSAARFFYCAKASRGEREAGLREAGLREATRRTLGEFPNTPGMGGDKVARNVHPTVKPIALMRWLVRLVTPPDGLVLDPFTGSGTTGCAAVLEGKRFIGCELSAEYAEIARARIAHHAAQGVLELEATNA